MTNYNTVSTLRNALNRVLFQIDDRFEVIVVDNHSSDGSLEILKDFEQKGKLRLVVEECSRGRGKQIAFEHCKGDVAIFQIDMDDLIKPVLSKVAGEYGNLFKDRVLHLGTDTTAHLTMVASHLVSQLGGWRDLNWGEDWEFWARAAKAGKYVVARVNLYDIVGDHPERRTLLSGTRHRYSAYHDLLLAGRRVTTPDERSSLLKRLLVSVARLRLVGRNRYNDSASLNFDPYAAQYDRTEILLEKLRSVQTNTTYEHSVSSFPNDEGDPVGNVNQR